MLATAERVWDTFTPPRQRRCLELLAELSAAVRAREVRAIAHREVPARAG